MQLIILFIFTLLSYFSVTDHETIERSFPTASKILVDNINGNIHVTGVSGKQLHFKAEKTITAESNDALAEAKRDVKLDVSTQGDFVRLYVDGPFREHDRGHRFYGYEVKFDYDIEVPIGTELILRTVNAGEIVVKGTSGTFDIRHVNGAITMEKVSGAGIVSSVNGPIQFSFAKNPTADVKIHTVNGKIDVHFPSPPNADLKFRTVNGHVYSDFDVAPLPLNASGTVENRNGKFIYKGDRSQSGRIGKGGPLLDFETVNGSVQLRTKSE
jgi:DUF4097 and DUF4098 domain-containing protein YvlB